MRNKNNPIAPIRDYSHDIMTPEDINSGIIVDYEQLKFNLAVLENFNLKFKPTEFSWEDFKHKKSSPLAEHLSY
jgi:hypothetical protein